MKPTLVETTLLETAPRALSSMLVAEFYASHLWLLVGWRSPQADGGRGFCRLLLRGLHGHLLGIKCPRRAAGRPSGAPALRPSHTLGAARAVPPLVRGTVLELPKVFSAAYAVWVLGYLGPSAYLGGAAQKLLRKALRVDRPTWLVYVDRPIFVSSVSSKVGSTPKK